MKRLALFICTLLCANVLLAQTEFIVGNLKYNVTSSNPPKVSVGKVDETITTANIPATVSYNGTTYSVTSIRYNAFWNCSSLTSVTIPNSVTSIGRYAFYDCSSLTSITIPNSVTTIEYGAFYDCSSLTSVTIPNSVTSIGNSAFSGCSSLTSITIPNSVTSIGERAFLSCSSLTSVTIPNSVTSIGDFAFCYCFSLTSVTIPNSVTSIEYGAFESCSSLTSVDIPNSVTSIGGGVFYNCSSLTSIDIPSSVTSIGKSAFKNCSSLTSIDIPSSVTSIGEAAFSCCSSLTSINIPNSVVTSIGFQTFINCSSLTSVTIGNSVTSIEGGAFYGCNSLTSVTFGESLAEIGAEAFATSSFLQNITCLGTNPPILYNNSFPYPNIATVTVPCGSLEAYSAPTSFWNMFFAGRISENGYNVEVSVNDETFGSVAVESDCSSATLTATANEGYVFLSWNDENTDNPRTVALTSDTSFTAIFALIDNSSLSEDAEFAELSVYPNPTRGKVTFSQAIEKIEVIDLSGKTLQTYENANEINMETLPAGVYHLRMTIGDKTTTRKIIKE